MHNKDNYEWLDNLSPEVAREYLPDLANTIGYLQGRGYDCPELIELLKRIWDDPA